MADVAEKSITKTRKVLATDMKNYVEVIIKEHKDVIPQERLHFLQNIYNFENNIFIKDSGTISMFANSEGLVMPSGAYNIFQLIRRIPGYGINKKHQSYPKGEILNDNTYYDYLKHVLVSGMSVEEFFRDTILHETMHFCGAGGGSLLREGFTELKTRELAQKYGLKASRCGYPKEVKIANELQKMFGSKISNQITFSRNSKEIEDILVKNFGQNVTNCFFDIEWMMNDIANKVYDHSKFGGLLGPLKKAKAYSQIDYSAVYGRLKEMSTLLKDRKGFTLKEIEGLVGRENER